jgi:hypothetical protein
MCSNESFSARRSSARAAPLGMSAPIVWEAWFEDSWICCCCCASSFASLDFPASVTRLTGPDYSGEKILTADLDLGRIADGKFDLDVVGHCVRPDVIRLEVNEKSDFQMASTYNEPVSSQSGKVLLV